MYKVHRLVERRTTLNSRKWENNKTVPFYIGQGTLNRAFNMNRYERTNAWNNKPFRGIIYWKRI